MTLTRTGKSTHSDVSECSKGFRARVESCTHDGLRAQAMNAWNAFISMKIPDIDPMTKDLRTIVIATVSLR